MINQKEYFVKLNLLVDGKIMPVEVANDSFPATEDFVKTLYTDEGVAFYLDSIDFEAELVNFEDGIYRRDITEILVARVYGKPKVVS